MSASLSARVLATLAYSQVFRFPLRAEEVFSRLVGCASKNSPQLKDVLEALQHLQHLGLVKKDHDLFYLPHTHQGENLSQKRKLGHDNSKSKTHDVKQTLLPLLEKNHSIVGVFITGSVAVRAALGDDDIDLLVVSRPNQLWLARFVTLLQTSGSGRRRPWHAGHSGKTVKNMWCFNMWLSLNSLRVPTHKRNIYTAYEVLQARFVYGHPQVWRKWLTDNAWVADLLPQLYTETLHQVEQLERESKPSSAPTSWFGWRPYLSVLNRVSFWVQKAYMSSHMTTELVDLDRAYFHPRSARSIVLDHWKLSLLQALHPRTVLATGVFDVLHQEHVLFLKQAKQLGGVLVVGIESDHRVRKLKGPGRPVNSARNRAQALRRFEFVDVVLVLPEKFDQPSDHEALIASIQPDVLAVSSHTPNLDAKRRILKKLGGRVEVVHDHNPQFSTTLLIQQTKSR